MSTTRRQWLKTGATGAAGLAAGSLLPGALKDVMAAEAAEGATGAEAAAKAAASAPGSAGFTGEVAHATHYGPFIGTVKNGRLEKVVPQASDKRPTPMLTEGVIARTYDKTRVAGPMVRKSYLEGFRTGKTKPALRGKEPFVQVSWDVALGLTAKAILDTIEKYGNEGCFSSSYGGWSHAGIFRPNVLQGRFFNLLGGSSMTSGDYSAGAGQIIMPLVLGDLEVYSAQTSWEQVAKHTEVLVFIGSDPNKNNRIEYTVADHEMFPNWEAIRKAGVKCISINPQRTTTDEVMDAEWVPIIPNTDTALFLAMSHHLLVTNRWNRDFIQQYTVASIVSVPIWKARTQTARRPRRRNGPAASRAFRPHASGSWRISLPRSARSLRAPGPSSARTTARCPTGPL